MNKKRIKKNTFLFELDSQTKTFNESRERVSNTFKVAR